MSKLKVALLGGSFNPSTIAHLRMGRQLLNKEKVDKVVYIPCGPRADKPNLIPGFHRIQFLKQDLEQYFGYPISIIDSDDPESLHRANQVVIDDYEVEKFKKIMPTSWLIQKYQSTFKDIHFRPVIGGDLIESMRSWEDYEEVLQHQDFVVFERDEREIEISRLPKKHDLIIDKKISKISSTNVRAIIQEKWNPEKQQWYPNMKEELFRYISPNVLDYIIENRLYVN